MSCKEPVITSKARVANEVHGILDVRFDLSWVRGRKCKVRYADPCLEAIFRRLLLELSGNCRILASFIALAHDPNHGDW
jgi:hypothetical protein